jgi:flagellar basal-body rod modification protein FlgD
MNIAKVSSPSATAATGASSGAPRPTGSTMDADTFMKLFTTQLANQNPMDPQNSSEFLNQFSQITSVQTMSELQKTMTALKSNLGVLTQVTQAVQAQSFLGHTVEYLDPSSGALKTSKVEAVRLTGGSAQLVVSGGTLIPTDSVRQMLN